MNGAALTKHHGFPARALVPGWIGASSCKWLSEIKVLDKEFDGNFMKPGYRLPNHPLKPGEPLNVDDSHTTVDQARHNMLWLIKGTERYMLWFWP